MPDRWATGRQLVVITHVPGIAELCEHQLEVRLAGPGRSSAMFV
jgi:DNA repair exonuclease SbcCD ATPase subunit